MCLHTQIYLSDEFTRMNEGRSFKFVCHNFSSEEFRESVRTECIRLRRLVWEKFRILSLSLRMRTRGLPYMTSAKFSYFLNPPVSVKNELILFLLSAFRGPPPPPIADVIYGSPLENRKYRLFLKC